MKIPAVALMLALSVVPAHAQMGGKHRHGDDKSTEKKPQGDDKAYQAALKRIPEPKEKYDPWSVARPAAAEKMPK